MLFTVFLKLIKTLINCKKITLLYKLHIKSWYWGFVNFFTFYYWSSVILPLIVKHQIYKSHSLPLTDNCIKSPPFIVPLPWFNPLCSFMWTNTHSWASWYQWLIPLRSFCHSLTKFPRSQYIWQCFIPDLWISERISVQAWSLAWKCSSVQKSSSLHNVGSRTISPPSLQSFPFFKPPTLLPCAPNPLQGVVDLAVSGCLTKHWPTPQTAKYS